MSLHEQYETLLRRGMPEHPRLKEKVDGWFDLCHQDENGFSDWGAIDMADGRDLVTMHALRWWLKAPRKGCPWSDTESGPSDRAVILEAGEGQRWVGCSTNHLNDDWNEIRRSTCILETIIAATAHLEPKTK